LTDTRQVIYKIFTCLEKVAAGEDLEFAHIAWKNKTNFHALGKFMEFYFFSNVTAYITTNNRDIYKLSTDN